jgi:hypothetical protein
MKRAQARSKAAECGTFPLCPRSTDKGSVNPSRLSRSRVVRQSGRRARSIEVSGSSLAKMTVAPASLAFGNQPVGSRSVEDNVVIGNEGVSALTVASATLTGASASHFRLGDNGWTMPVPPDGRSELGVVLSRTTTGSKTANLRHGCGRQHRQTSR